MDVSMLDKVDVERLYQHVLQLEGERHPITSPNRLRETADYIEAELRSYGVQVRRQEFHVGDYPDTFTNVEGWTGDKDAPCAAVMNHYDTVVNTPGANDNAAGVAVTLECARILAQEDGVPPVRFLSFTLEEGNPAHQSKGWASAQALGLIDEQLRYKAYGVAKLIDEHESLAHEVFDFGRAGTTLGQAIAEATEQLQDRLPEPLVDHLRAQEGIYASVTSYQGQDSHLGAWLWMAEALDLGKDILFGICLDEIGRVHMEEGCQSLPEQLTWEMLQTYKIDIERRIGDWAFVITDGAASELGQVFCEHCEHESVDLPYGHFHIPMNYEQIQKELPQAVGSDYSAFWNAGIPALFLFDTASWRTPSRGHSMADTIDRLDFDQIARVNKATLATLIDPALRS